MPAPAKLASNKIVAALQFAAQKGLDVDNALDQLTELVQANPRKALVSVKTEIGTTLKGEPLIVAWDTCHECKNHISNCNCPNGPKQPPYIAAWVAEAAAKYQTTKEAIQGLCAAVPTSVSSPEISEVPFSPEAGSVSGEKSISPGATGSVGVPLATCSGCGVGVTEDDADQNDDGSWTCYPCQTAEAKA